MPYLLKVRSTGSKKKIIGFPYAGGFGSFFHQYASFIDSKYDLLSVEYPGRRRDPEHSSLISFHQLCLKIAEMIMENKDDELFFFGISMGGYVAFKVAQIIENYLGRSLKHVLMVSVASETRLLSSISIAESWLSSFSDNKPGQFDKEFIDYVKMLMLKDKVILETMRLEASCLMKTPITVSNGIKDSYCHSEESMFFWRNKTNQEFKYETYDGDHIPIATDIAKIMKLFAYSGCIKYDHGV